MLPLWPDVMDKYKIDPKIWKSNIREYISLFSYEKYSKLIITINQKMRKLLESDPYLCQML